MRVPLEWLAEFVSLPVHLPAREVAEALTRVGLAVETIDGGATAFTGPVVVGRVTQIEELTGLRKPIRVCAVDVGGDHGGIRSIVCGATNVRTGDDVVVALPGSVLPGGEIAERVAYQRRSEGMICSARELGLAEDHEGVLILGDGPTGRLLEPGLPAGEVLGLDEPVLVLGITPDRGYALSIRGVAREAGLALGVDFRDPADIPAPADPHRPDPGAAERGALVRAHLAAGSGADRLHLLTLTGADPEAVTPEWAKRRLRACGMRPISAVVDVTNYVLLETGQPLHAFDRSQVGEGLTARWALAGEQLQTLDHVVRTLTEEDLVISDERQALALAGVMGGAASEVGPTTTGIVVEAAHFLPRGIARTSRRHRLSTEASRRFERGVDPEVAEPAARRAAALLAEWTGAHLLGHSTAGEPAPRRALELPAALPGEVAGMPIPEAEVRDRLVAIGCEVGEGTGPPPRVLHVWPPSWRPDLVDPADCVEEVLRLRGYETLPATLPRGPVSRGWTAAQHLRQQVGRLCAGMGGVEVLTYPFTGPQDWQQAGFPTSDPRRRALRLANPLSEERPFLRTELLTGLLAVAHRNIARGNARAVIYEIGIVMRPRADLLRADLPGPDLPGSGLPADLPVDLPAGLAVGLPPRPPVDRRPTEAEVAALDALLPEQPLHLGLVDWRTGRWEEPIRWIADLAADLGCPLAVTEVAQAPFHPGRAGLLSLADGTVLGVAGQLHPRVCEAYGLPTDSGAAEIDLDTLIAAATPVIASPLSSHPVASEDLAFVVAETVRSSDLGALLRDGGGPLVESVTLFDVYRGPQVPDGEVSMAFTLRLRAPDRTLTPAEIRTVREGAVAAAATLGARLRAE